jgi:hypothetical protein
VSLVFWELVVDETPEDVEPVPAESDEAVPGEVVEGIEDPVDEPLVGVVTAVPSVGVDADEPELFVPDVDSTGVDELDPAEADDVEEPDEEFDPVDVDDDPDVVAELAGCDVDDPDEVVLVGVVSLEDDDDELLDVEVPEVDAVSDVDG